MANKHKVYTSDLPLRDKAAVLVGCTAQDIANFVERALKEFGISREQLSVIHYLDDAKADTMTVNQLRESLIDEDALDAALASGHLGGAALDVFELPPEGEPPRFLRYSNVVVTPHIGGATRESLQQGADMIAAEIVRFAASEPLVNVVGGRHT